MVEAHLRFERAAATFPNHPSRSGLARVKIAEGDSTAARQMLQGQLARVPIPDLAAAIGDLSLKPSATVAAAPLFPWPSRSNVRMGERPAAASGARKILGRARTQPARGGAPRRSRRAIATGHLYDGYAGVGVPESGPADRMRAVLPISRYGRVHKMRACCGMQRKFARPQVSPQPRWNCCGEFLPIQLAMSACVPASARSSSV